MRVVYRAYEFLLGVKSGKAQNKQMFSGLRRKADTRAFMSTRPSSTYNHQLPLGLN